MHITFATWLMKYTHATYQLDYYGEALTYELESNAEVS
jgi:hypothetical protein